MPQTTRPVSDIGRLQQEAMARMMEMQKQANSRGGWSTDPNVPRQNRAPRREQPEPAPPPVPPPRPQAPPSQNNRQQQTGNRNQPHNQRRTPGGNPQQQQQQRRQQQRPAQPEPEKKTDTTLLQDILGAVGLDDDRVLILGLILILINSKADTTLILALCYLLL